MFAISPDWPNFLDTDGSRFKEVHAIMDTYFRQLQVEGRVGAMDKHAKRVSWKMTP
jgi:hypothetical protein